MSTGPNHCCTRNCRQGRDCPTWQACALPEPDDEREPVTGAELWALAFWPVVCVAGTVAGVLWVYFR